MDESSQGYASLERDAAAYVSLLASLRTFTLQRQVIPEEPEVYFRWLDVYRSDDPAEVSGLRRLLAARPLGRHCMCIGSAAISLECGAASVELTVHHGRSVRWPAAGSGDFELERGRELAEWMAARGLPDIRDEMDRSEREFAQTRAEQQA